MSEWKDIKKAPKNTRVQLGWWKRSCLSPNLIWEESIGVAIETFWLFFKIYHREATHYKELPPPPKEQINHE